MTLPIQTFSDRSPLYSRRFLCQITSQEKDKQELQRESAELQRKLQETLEKVGSLTEELARGTEATSSLQQKLASAKAAAAGFEDEINELRGSLNSTRSRAERSSDEVCVLAGPQSWCVNPSLFAPQNRRLQEAIAAKDVDAMAAQATINRLSTDSSRLSAELASVKQQLGACGSHVFWLICFS